MQRDICWIPGEGHAGQGDCGWSQKVVQVLGEEIAVKAPVYTINGFSAHANQRASS